MTALAATPPLAWVRRRFPAQVAWGRRRLDPRSPQGFWLTFTIAAGALAAWAFGGLTQDVTGHDDTALADPHVTAWVVAHRTGWLTSALSVLTWLGSTAFIIPAGLAVGLYFLIRRRTWRPLALLAAAVAGAVGLYDIVKPLVGRPRPPAAIWIGHFTGAAFPSGHATQSAAFYAMLAIVLGTGLSFPEAGHPVERRRPGRPHRRRLPHLPRRPLADRRARRLRPRRLLGGHRGGRPADHITQHRQSQSSPRAGQAPTLGHQNRRKAA